MLFFSCLFISVQNLFICLALVCVPPEAHHLFKVIYFSCCLWYSFSCLFVCLFVESSMFICSIRFAFYFVLFFCLFADLIWTQFIRLESWNKRWSLKITQWPENDTSASRYWPTPNVSLQCSYRKKRTSYENKGNHQLTNSVLMHFEILTTKENNCTELQTGQ